MERFPSDLDTPFDRIRPTYRFNETCHGTVPQAIRAFLEAVDYEDAVRNAISLGGDADTLALHRGGHCRGLRGRNPAGPRRGRDGSARFASGLGGRSFLEPLRAASHGARERFAGLGRGVRTVGIALTTVFPGPRAQPRPRTLPARGAAA